jgi:IS30 family transposase
MSNYTQLTREQRYQIYALMKARVCQTEIATVVGVHKSTISRERRRNRGLRGYRPKQAQRLAEIRREEATQPRISSDTWALVKQLLREDWSPEQVSGWLFSEYLLSAMTSRTLLCAITSWTLFVFIAICNRIPLPGIYPERVVVFDL